MFYIHRSVLSEIVLDSELQEWKTKCTTEKQESFSRVFPLGFTTEHLEVIREAGRPVRRAGALLVGWDKLGVPGSVRSLSVCLYVHVFLLRYVFVIFLPLMCHMQTPTIYHKDGRWTRGKEGNVFMAVSYLSLSSSCFPMESEGIGPSVYVYRCTTSVCV